jgi:hypothetical protein
MAMMYVVCNSPEKRLHAQQRILRLLHEQGIEGDVQPAIVDIDGQKTSVYKIEFDSEGTEHEDRLIPQIENALNGPAA